MSKIGILGGTFNPIHNAHLQMAQNALLQAKLDQILFMPSKNPPHKQNTQIASEEDRSTMVKLAIESFPSFVYSDFELKRDGLTYTSDTLQLLTSIYPDDHFYFIMGGDSFFQLEHWHEPAIIMKYATILAISRDGATRKMMAEHQQRLKKWYKADIQIIDMDDYPVSSSQIREMIHRTEDVKMDIPSSVYAYILDHHLYSNRAT